MFNLSATIKKTNKFHPKFRAPYFMCTHQLITIAPRSFEKRKKTVTLKSMKNVSTSKILSSARFTHMCTIILNYFEAKINFIFSLEMLRPCSCTRVPFDYKVGSKSPTVIPPLAIVDKTWISHRLNLTRATDQRLPLRFLNYKRFQDI